MVSGDVGFAMAQKHTVSLHSTAVASGDSESMDGMGRVRVATKEVEDNDGTCGGSSAQQAGVGGIFAMAMPVACEEE